MKLEKEYSVQPVLHPHNICTEVPGSKSITNRALLIAAMAEGTSVLKGILFSDDSRNFIQALIDMQFPVEVDEKNCMVKITGYGGKIPCVESDPQKEHRIYVGSAGTAARFLTAYLGLAKGNFYIDSSEQMKKRPMKELIDALEELGVSFSYEEEKWHFPFHIHSTDNSRKEVTVDIDKSSQFLSALLIASVLFPYDFTVHVTGSHGMEYVKMTMAMMEQFGVCVRSDRDGSYTIAKDAAYQAREYQIEPDLSAACYFYAMSPLLSVSSQVLHVHTDCLQGDIRFLDVLKDMGCRITDEVNGVTVLPPENHMMSGGSWDLSSFSDQTLTLAAIAPFANERVTIQNVGHIRLQECDRIHAIMSNLKEMGIPCEESDGTIVIDPGTPKAATIKTYDDHRVAMAFSLAGLRADGIIIENPACCRKTFENYFEVLEEAVY